MLFEEYQKEVRRFADYPAGIVNGNEVQLLYPVLGLVEKFEAAKVKMRLVAEDETSTRIEALVSELGDVCWFCAEILSVLGFEADLSRFHDLYEEDFGTAAADISGILANTIRDNNGIVTESQALLIKEKVEGIIWTVSQMAPKVCLTYLWVILHYHFQKLQSQHDRELPVPSSGDAM